MLRRVIIVAVFALAAKTLLYDVRWRGGRPVLHTMKAWSLLASLSDAGRLSPGGEGASRRLG
jgi:hypothetical protein